MLEMTFAVSFCVAQVDMLCKPQTLPIIIHHHLINVKRQRKSTPLTAIQNLVLTLEPPMAGTMTRGIRIREPIMDR
jgi:hypothetical protein